MLALSAGTGEAATSPEAAMFAPGSTHEQESGD